MVKQIRKDGISCTALALDPRGREAFGAGCYGASSGGNFCTLVVDDGLASAAALLLEATDTLSVSADTYAILADGVEEAVISVNTSHNCGYAVLLDGELYSYSGASIAPVAGVVTETFATEIAGTYTIYMWEQAGNYPSGMIVIEAT